MTRKRQTLMLCACEFWCGDPYITGEDVLDDARQVASIVKEKKIPSSEVEQVVVWVSCRMLSKNRELSPQEAVRKALWLYDATEEDMRIEM